MSIILVLIPLSIVFAVAFLAAFIWAVRSGQYEDTCTPSMRLLLDESVAARGSKVGPPSPGPARTTSCAETSSAAPGEGETPSASGHETHSLADEDSGFMHTKVPSAARDVRTSPKPHCALGGEGER